MVLTPLALAPLQLGGLFSGPLGQMLVVLAAVAVVILADRLFLKTAWRLVTIIVIVVDTLLLFSFFGINIL